MKFSKKAQSATTRKSDRPDYSLRREPHGLLLSGRNLYCSTSSIAVNSVVVKEKILSPNSARPRITHV